MHVRLVDSPPIYNRMMDNQCFFVWLVSSPFNQPINRDCHWSGVGCENWVQTSIFQLIFNGKCHTKGHLRANVILDALIHHTSMYTLKHSGLRPCSYFRCGWAHSGGHFSKKIWKMISMARTTLSQHAVTWPEKVQSMPPEMQLTGQNQRRLVPKVWDFKSPTYCQHRSRPRLAQGHHSTRVRTEQRPWKEGRGGLQRLQRWISWQAPSRWCWYFEVSWDILQSM